MRKLYAKLALRKLSVDRFLVEELVYSCLPAITYRKIDQIPKIIHIIFL